MRFTSMIQGVLDRSPCGTGTCARMATLHARGLLGVGDDFRHESVLGTVFVGALRRGERTSLVPGGRPDDHRHRLDHRLRPVRGRPDRYPFPNGWTVGDIW